MWSLSRNYALLESSIYPEVKYFDAQYEEGSRFFSPRSFFPEKESAVSCQSTAPGT
jgi:hypothetical protein